MTFGVQEVIRPISLNKVIAERDQFLFGEIRAKVDKVAESMLIEGDELKAIQAVLTAVKHMQAGNSNYTCIELFGDPSQKVKGVNRMNVCHMRKVK